MGKRAAAFLLAICMIAAMIPATATAVEAGEVVESGVCGEDAQWTFYSDGRLAVSGTGAMYDYGAGESTPWAHLPITAIVVGEGISAIGERSFSGCDGLTELNLPDTVQTIGREAFQNCTGLVRVTVGRGVREIPPYCFKACTALTSVTFKADGVRIGLNAFYGCSQLKTVTAPSKIDVSEGGAFFACSSLVSVPMISGPVGVGSFGICASLPSVTLGDDVTSIDMSAFQYCTSLTSITIPDSVTEVGGSAFRECTSLNWVELGTGVTSLGTYCFYGVGDDCTLFFRGDAPETGSYTLYDVSHILFCTGREGWTTPKWKNIASRAVTTEEYILQSDYYTKPYLYSFFFETADGEKLDQVTVTIGGEEFFSEDQSYLSVRMAALAEGDTVQISREGYDAVSLPVELLSAYQYIRFYPEGSEDPTLRVLYAEKNGSGEYLDLHRTPLVLTENSPDETVAFYLDVDWGAETEGAIYLSQSKDPAEGIPLQNGWNEAQNISAKLRRGSGLYFLMVSGNGTVYSQRISAAIGSQFSNQVTTNFAPEVSIPAPDLEVVREMDLDLQMLEKAKISMTFRTDGTFVAVLGVELDKAEDIYGVSEEVKEALEGSGSVQSLMENLWLGRGLGSTYSPSKFAIEMSSSMVGYLEGKAVTFGDGSTGLIVTECKVGLCMEGGLELRLEYPVMATPVYLELSADGKVEFTTAMYGEGSASRLVPGTGELNAELELGLEAGLGWDSIAAAGVQGVVTFVSELDLPTTEWTICDDYRLYANGSWKLNAEFLCLEASVELLKTKDYYLYGHAKGATFQMAALPADDGVETLVWHPQSRDYLLASETAATGGEAGDAVVADGVYPYADVQLAVLEDGTQLVVWTADPGTRGEDNNRTVLYYSYCDGAAWSAPAPVETRDDGTGDFAPVLQVLDGSAYLVWQDADKELTAGDTVQTMFEALDISCAVFDPETRAFSSMDTVGTECYDGTPSITLLDGMPALVWTSYAGGVPLSGNGQLTTLYRALWDGSGWQTEVLARELGAVDQTAADGGLVWFSADTDYDGTTGGDREIFLFDGTLHQLTDNDVMDSKPELSRGTVSWYSDGQLVLGGDIISLAAHTDRYQYLRGVDGLEAMVYVVTDGGTQLSSLYASFNDGSGWGEPICLDGGNGSIGSFSAQFCGGVLSVAVRERGVAGGALSAVARLKVYTVAPFCDLVLEQADYMAHSLVSGGSLGVRLDLYNAGMTTIDLIQVVVKSGSEVLADKIYDLELLSGQRGLLMAAVELPEAVFGELTVEVSPVGCTDCDGGNNAMGLTLRLQDLSLEETCARSEGGLTQVTVLAVNRGLQAFSGVTLTVKDPDGAVLSTWENFSLAAGESRFVSFTLDRAFESNTILTIEATGLAEENLYANNRAAVVVTAPAEEALRLLVGCAETAAGLAVDVELDNTAGEKLNCTLFCAAYDENGRMLAVQMLSGQAEAGEIAARRFLLEMEAEAVCSIRVFALTEGYAPLMGCAEIRLSL